MDTEKDRSFTENLDAVLTELQQRSQQNVQTKAKLWWWRATIRFSYLFKRLFDIAFSLCAMIVLLPFGLLLAVLIKLTSPGPVFFVQTRVGKYGRHFRFYKFRSMYQDAEQRKKELESQNQSADGVIFKMKNDPRITPIGRIIRKTSIDELPQFLNVLLGDMSLIGPRPPLPSEVVHYTMEDRKRLLVRPGMTCLWQISGRSDLPFKQQAQLDKEYIIARSLKQELLILLRTVPAILSGRGAY